MENQESKYGFTQFNELINRALNNLEPERELYVYGFTDEQTADAAAQLRTAGYQNVAELKCGGLAAWKANSFPLEGDSSVVA